MKLDFHVKNIGKLTDAKLEFGRFTVFVGHNDTGKRFALQLMHAIFDAINSNHADAYLRKLFRPVAGAQLLREINYSTFGKSDVEEVNIIFDNIEKMETAFTDFAADDVDEFNAIIAGIIENVEAIREAAEDLHRPAEENERTLPVRLRDVNKHWQEFDDRLREMQTALQETNFADFLDGGVQHQLDHNMQQAFQVKSVAELPSKRRKPSSVDIGEMQMFAIQNGDLQNVISHAALPQMQSDCNVWYLDSAVHWQLMPSLRYFHLNRRELRNVHLYDNADGVAKSFYDLAHALKAGRSGRPAFAELHRKLTGKQTIDGKIEVPDYGEWEFAGKRKSLLLSASAGAVNLGMLALLMERKLLNENSILFIDKPEAHLHPAWQVLMAETLFALASEGVHIAITTHSPYIIKWLEVQAKKNPQDKALIALNQFPINNEQAAHQNFDEKMTAIKKEFTKPFTDLDLVEV